MATPCDVVSELVRLTESGELEWEPKLFDDAGLPTRWSNARHGDCVFDAFTNGPVVRVDSGNAGFGRTTIARGEDAQPLLDALSQKQGQKGKTLDEVLDFAYMCLTEPE